MYSFFNWIIEFFLETLPSLLIDFFLWILEFIGFIVLKIINVILEKVVPLISTEDFDKSAMWDGLQNAWSGMPTEILQIATYVKVPEAISLITASLLIKFIKSKIPFIG